MSSFQDNMLEAYLFETNTLLESLDELLLNAEKTGDFTSDEVNEIFRAMHTIKGSSAMMEFNPLMEVAHHVEDLFFDIRENGMDRMSSDQKNDLFNLLFKCTDRLREDVQIIESGGELDNNISDFIELIDSFLNKLKGGGNAATQASATTTAPAPSSSDDDIAFIPEIDAPYFMRLNFEPDIGMEHLRAFMVVTSVQELGLQFCYAPDDIETNPSSAESIIEHGFYLGLHTEEDVETIVAEIPSLNNVASYEIIVNPIYQELAEQSMLGTKAEVPKEEPSTPPTSQPQNIEKPEVKPAAKPAADNGVDKLKNQVKQSLISVNLAKLDNLMAIVGEIVITQSMVSASPELRGLKLDNFYKSTRQLRKLTDDLQDIAMSLRMVSVSGIFQKMSRIVRDMSKALNKDVKLTIIGENTEVDKTIVDNIADPIMHIVRNAMDHGIETTPEERIAAGKPAQGEIVLSAEHTGSDVIIRIQNDGKDFNTDAILAKAERKGLLTKAPEEYAQKEILSLLMLPGFSTNAQVTEYSGRGVGLDVVKKNVESVGGTVTLSNDVGHNCAFTLKIPLTLAIVDGMEVSVSGETFTLPISSIRQSFKATADDVVYDPYGNEIIRCMGEFYPIVRLSQAFNMPEHVTDISEGILIWLESGDKSFCLFVDELIGEQQVVVKPLPSYLNSFDIKSMGISGCTILGNGNISLILDVGNIYVSASHRFKR